MVTQLTVTKEATADPQLFRQRGISELLAGRRPMLGPDFRHPLLSNLNKRWVCHLQLDSKPVNIRLGVHQRILREVGKKGRDVLMQA